MGKVVNLVSVEVVEDDKSALPVFRLDIHLQESDSELRCQPAVAGRERVGGLRAGGWSSQMLQEAGEGIRWFLVGIGDGTPHGMDDGVTVRRARGVAKVSQYRDCRSKLSLSPVALQWEETCIGLKLTDFSLGGGGEIFVFDLLN